MKPTLHSVALEELQVGDTVKVEFKVPPQFGGWANTWIEEMDGMVGQTTTIRSIEGQSGIRLDGNPYAFPAFCVSKQKANVRKVELNPNYTAEVSKDNIEIDGYELSFEKLQELVNAARGVGTTIR